MTSEDQKILFEKLGKQMNYTLGLPNKRKTKEIVNGLIITLILIAALSYMLIIK